ncbi:MAG: ketopantoate reductase family protein [Ardenticatenaceae bacterium]|nr:ketopantoate reductase family protein [Ardenticatenaceae bacterium]MCB9445386.1 ketopantoate reductase family protein [Ardenticatenaceae bacterium]
MKILVYGAGAVGGYLGSQLCLAHHDVTFVDMEATAHVINTNGLTIVQGGQSRVAQPKAVSSVAQAFMAGADYDLILMGVKSYDLKAALDPLVAFCPSPKTIITIQNGIGVERPYIDQYGAEHIIAGSFTIPISKETINRLVVEKEDRGLALAPTQNGQNIKQWVNFFNQAGVQTSDIKDYQSMKWSKAMLNIIGNATSAILNRPPETVYKSAAMFDLEVRMLQETLAVMKKLGLKVVDLPGSPAKRLAGAVNRVPRALLKPIMTRLVASGRGDKMPSFHIDLTASIGKSEVIFHNGAIAKAGMDNGIATPVNAALTDVLWKLTRNELDWRKFDGQPKRLMAEVRRFEQKV